MGNRLPHCFAPTSGGRCAKFWNVSSDIFVGDVGIKDRGTISESFIELFWRDQNGGCIGVRAKFVTTFPAVLARAIQLRLMVSKAAARQLILDVESEPTPIARVKDGQNVSFALPDQ